MPEIAEVKTLINGFAQELNVLSSIQVQGINGHKFVEAGRFQGYDKIKHDKYYQIVKHGARGKLAYIQLKLLDSKDLEESSKLETSTNLDWYLTFHFGMSGNFRYPPKQISETSHYLVRFKGTISTGEANEIWYHDVRRFGRMAFLSPVEFNTKISKLAPDVLSDNRLLDGDIIERFRRFNKWNICKLLMNQEKAFSGIGNYMMSEILYETCISPYISVKDLTDNQLCQLYQAARNLAERAYQCGGASLYTYTGFKGDQSYFKKQLKVYNRQLTPDGKQVTRIPADQAPDKRTKFVCWAVQCGSPQRGIACPP